MVSWSTVKTLLFTLGPIFVPKVIQYYRSIRASSRGQKTPIRPTPSHITRALNILFITALLALISTLPYFAPENIFTLTTSRLQIPVDVLFTRLSALRPLTPTDEALRLKLVSLESRLLYLTFGPSPLANCQFCSSDDAKSYLYYALPTLLTPHLLHIAVLGLITSSVFSGREGGIWRTQATIAGVALGAAEVYLVGTYDHKANARALRLADVDAFHWRLRLYRGLAIALVDLFLGWGIYLSSTNRAFITPPSVAERLETSTRMLETANRKLHAVGITRNVVVRDEGLRTRADRYWGEEGRIMGEVFEEREVIEGLKGALGRVDIVSVTEEAGRYAEGVVGGGGTIGGEGGMG
ncbi:MAG: hypothetical protein M1827_002892 [Pycnora praestabilis]|nr:MAG: hypothetical protein M1827_002892 [Pycnora praestabilis]